MITNNESEESSATIGEVIEEHENIFEGSKVMDEVKKKDQVDYKFHLPTCLK